MRWGDDGAGGEYDVDDDPEDARRDAMIPPPGGNFPRIFLPVGDLLLSVAEKLCVDAPTFLGQGEKVRQRGAGGEGTWPGPTRGL